MGFGLSKPKGGGPGQPKQKPLPPKNDGSKVRQKPLPAKRTSGQSGKTDWKPGANTGGKLTKDGEKLAKKQKK